MTNKALLNITHKTKDRVTRTSLKNAGALIIEVPFLVFCRAVNEATNK